MDKTIRNTLRNVVTQCRKRLEDAIGDVLEGKYSIRRNGTMDDAAALTHLTAEEHAFRAELVARLRHIEAHRFSSADAAQQLIREVAFTHLNRLCAYKMLERRRVIRESVSRGSDSNGFKFYLADHPEDEDRLLRGQQDIAFQHFLTWLGASLSDRIGILFSPHDAANRLYPPHLVLMEVLAQLNRPDLKEIWDEDETIGWVYQYFTPKEQRDQARKESAAPRNSYELAFRNQFFTPRYVVEFLTDNSLGRTWYEMRQGQTALAARCRYLVRRYDEVFLAAMNGEYGETQHAADMLNNGTETTAPPFTVDDGAQPRLIELAHCVNGYDRYPLDGRGDIWQVQEAMYAAESLDAFKTQQLLDVLFYASRAARHMGDYSSFDDRLVRLANEVRARAIRANDPNLPQAERLRQPVFIPYRAKKDPRVLKILDPACGSGHFLLYCFDVLLTIYDEAYDDRELGTALKEEYPTRDDLHRAIPGLILRHNLYGVDIDPRAAQIAGLALWLRAQRAYEAFGLKMNERPPITRTNIVCAEPMPGEREMLDEFLRSVDTRLHRLVRTIWERMQLASEAGSLLKIEREMADELALARQVALTARPPVNMTFFAQDRQPEQMVLTHEVGSSERLFWEGAEQQLLTALERFAAHATNGTGFQRALFADDAVQGFAFIDCCRQTFDVVLMNPPFGAASHGARQYIERIYPRTKNDLFAAFIERGIGLLYPGSILGAITSRTGFFLTSFERWREEIVLTEARPIVVADLGHGVLDTAMVETAAYCLEATR